MKSKKISIYLADDHTVVRKGMIRLLKTFARVEDVKESANGKELLALIEHQVPDAVIMDVEMPVMGGVDAAKIISTRFPEVKMLVLTMHTEEVFVHKLMDIGVHGFLSKSAEPEEVERALYAIIDKDFYKNDIVEKALHKMYKQQRQDAFTKLTPREVEILLLICKEHSPVEISERLQISEKTYFNHRSNIMEKTGARNSVGLVRFAVEKGLYSFS